MAIYTIEAPDGRRIKIEAGDEGSALAAANDWISQNPIQAGNQPITSESLMGLAREQFTPDPALQPRVEGNPFASSLPGPLGQFQNSSRAYHNGMIEGLTGNLSNELASGVIAVPDAIGSALQGNGFDIGRSFNNLYGYGQRQSEGSAALNPSVNNLGNLTGAAVLGAKLGPVSGTQRATTPLGMAVTGALEGGIYGGVYGAGGAEGNDRWLAGAKGAGEGAVGGALIGGAAGKVLPQISEESRIIARGLQADGLTPTSAAIELDRLGPAAVYGDLGPNLQAKTAAIATLPGAGAKTVVDGLTGRTAMANARIRAGVDDALGPARPASSITNELDANRQAVNTLYEPVFAEKALSDNPFMDSQPILDAIDSVVPRVVGGTRSDIQRVRSMLLDPTTGLPTQDPQIIMAVRQELDGMIGSETNTTTANVLGDLRKVIDQDLDVNVPGLKAVDAQFEEIAKQGEAFEEGGMLLGDGKTARDPADLMEQMINATPGQNFRLSQGARTEINRIIGTKANDRVALRGILRGDGSWNYEKLSQVFGKDAADELMSIIDRESQFAQLENLATSGSRTQVLNAAQKEIQGNVGDPGIMREAMNFQYGNAAAKVADRFLGGLISSRREGIVNNVADALMGRGLTPQMQGEVQRIIDGMSDYEKSIISALMAGQASSGSTP